jgi:transposase InsO family protein
MKEKEALTMTMDDICGWFNISRQAHYQMQCRERQRQVEEERVLDMVRTVRSLHPRMGVRKLLYKLQAPMQEQGISLGRDRLFELLRKHDLLIRPRRRSRRTTWPGMWRSENLLAGLDVTAVNQVWVSDITYIDTEKDFCYLFLLTDLYSRYIAGWHVSSSLSVEGALAALQMAMDAAGEVPEGLIHHSDRGVQYTCYDYRDALHAVEALSSMGEAGNCYENAYAERVNGILKLEYGLGERFLHIEQVRLAVQEAVTLYNCDRPHLSLGYRTPLEVYQTSQSAAHTRPDDTLAVSGNALCFPLSAKGSGSRNGSSLCSPSPEVSLESSPCTQTTQTAIASLDTPASEKASGLGDGPRPARLLLRLPSA